MSISTPEESYSSLKAIADSGDNLAKATLADVDKLISNGVSLDIAILHGIEKVEKIEREVDAMLDSNTEVEFLDEDDDTTIDDFLNQSSAELFAERFAERFAELYGSGSQKTILSGIKLYCYNDYEDMYQFYFKEFEKNNVVAGLLLATMYCEGIGCNADLDEAFSVLNKIRKGANFKSMATFYYDYSSVTKEMDYTNLTRAINTAICCMGIIKKRENNAPLSEIQQKIIADGKCRKIRTGKSNHEVLNYGLAYEHGIDVEKDTILASYLFNSVDAVFLHEFGEQLINAPNKGVHETGVDLIHLSRKKGFIKAHHTLGNLYMGMPFGVVDRDVQLAKDFFATGAELGEHECARALKRAEHPIHNNPAKGCGFVIIGLIVLFIIIMNVSQ